MDTLLMKVLKLEAALRFGISHIYAWEQFWVLNVV